MKNMNRREGKKIAVMAAIIMGLMLFAFMPLASATVTSFTVTPSTGIAGAVDSYNALVTTDGVTSINITIPAGFIGVVPMSGGVELARIDFWNSSTKAYYGYATFTANDTYPTTKIDAYCDLGGATARTTQTVNYTPGATNTFVSHVGDDTSSVITKLPTETVNGSINVTITCTAFYLDDVMFAIKQFVRNPTAGNYVFSADDSTGKVDANVEIISAGEGQAVALFGNCMWGIKYGPINEIPNFQSADHWLAYGSATAIPVLGDFDNDGFGDIAVFKDSWWWIKYGPVNLIPDFQDADHQLAYGSATGTQVVGDFDNNGIDDIAIFLDSYWWIKYGPVDLIPDFQGEDHKLAYGSAGIPLVGDFDNDGVDDIALYLDCRWWIKYGPVDLIPDFQAQDHTLLYGAAGWTPLVGDFDKDGIDDIALYQDCWWSIKYGPVDLIPDYQGADHWLAYGAAGWTPLVGDFGNP